MKTFTLPLAILAILLFSASIISVVTIPALCTGLFVGSIASLLFSYFTSKC